MSHASGPEWSGVGIRIAGVVMAIAVFAVLAVSYLTVRAFNRAIEPELASRALLIGSLVRETVQRPLERGVPFDALVGLDSYLTEALDKLEEADRISIVTASGTAVAKAERQDRHGLLRRTGIEQALAPDSKVYSLPIVDGNRLVGRIEVRVRPDFLQSRLHDVFLDVMVITLVATLIAKELSIGIAVATVGKPLRRVRRILDEQRAGVFLHCIRPGGIGGLGRTVARLNDHSEDLARRLATLPAHLRNALSSGLGSRVAEGSPVRLHLSDVNDIRPALFLLSVSTEIATSFLPVYAAAATRPNWLKPEFAAAAPLLVYLIALAALMPFGGLLVQRLGARRLFVASLVPIVPALMAMGLAGTTLQIAFWRGVIAVFYAAATIACQEYALRASDGGTPARALGSYLAVIYGGVFCGSALGGVIAGRFGFTAAFVTAAVIAAMSVGLALAMMSGQAGLPHTGAVDPTGSRPERRADARHVALLFGIAIPMNAATAIFVWYLTPLMLAADGVGTADIARVVMLYYLVAILFGPVVTRLVAHPAWPTALVLAGSLSSATALLSLSLWNGVWAVACAMTGLGLGHTLIRAPQYVIAVHIASRGGPSVGSLRLCERIGAIAGLTASTFLLRDLGAPTSIRILGLILAAGAVLFAVVELASIRRRP